MSPSLKSRIIRTTSGKLFAEQKRRYWEKNLNGEYSDAALKNVIQKNIGKGTAAYTWYSGKVDPEWARERLKVGKFPTDAKGFRRQMQVRQCYRQRISMRERVAGLPNYSCLTSLRSGMSLKRDTNHQNHLS